MLNRTTIVPKSIPCLRVDKVRLMPVIQIFPCSNWSPINIVGSLSIPVLVLDEDPQMSRLRQVMRQVLNYLNILSLDLKNEKLTVHFKLRQSELH